jgi:hypothetical protein
VEGIELKSVESGMKGCRRASPIVFGPRTLVRTWGTRVDLWDPSQA